MPRNQKNYKGIIKSILNRLSFIPSLFPSVNRTYAGKHCVWLMKIPLPRRKSNSVTTCCGRGRGGMGANPSGDGQSDTVESWFVNVCVPVSEWTTERESIHFIVKIDLTYNVHKSFPFHLCAGSDPKVINHSSVVTTDILSDIPPSRRTVH